MEAFGPKHYVPVLKCKRGEKKALEYLSPETREGLTPLLEIVERTDKTLSDHLETAMKGIEGAVGSRGCFVDTRELAPLGPAAAAAAFEAVHSKGIPFVPATGITRESDVDAALAHKSRGLCIRLTREEFEKGHLPGGLTAFLKKHSLAEEDVDLVVDLGPIGEMVTHGALRLATSFLRSVPSHGDWRTLTIVAAAFPKGMGIVERHSHLLVERIGWMMWRALFEQGKKLGRLPAFGDCAIQHPAGVEGFDYRYMKSSAAIRYTTGDHWLLIKGQALQGTHTGTKQFPKLAGSLVSGPFKAHFRGSAHCAGCREALDAANGAKGKGSQEAWRRIGTNHHLTTVVEQLAGLPWP